MAEKRVSLYEALLKLKTADEGERFLKDLCTPSELRDLNERWLVAQMLDGGAPYREIHESRGVSTTTIGRVARFLNNEDYKGYKLILERINDKKRQIADSSAKIRQAFGKKF